jgi:hypothetical protein
MSRKFEAGSNPCAIASANTLAYFGFRAKEVVGETSRLSFSRPGSLSASETGLPSTYRPLWPGPVILTRPRKGGL